MSDAIEIIKDELARIDEAENISIVLTGEDGDQYYVKDILAEKVDGLAKALSVAVEALEDVNHGFSKSGLRYGGMQYEQISAKAITTIANILSGGKDGK